MNTDLPSRNQTRVLRVLRAFTVKPRIHREAAKSAKSAKISRRKILSCQQRSFGLYYRSVFIRVHLWFRLIVLLATGLHRVLCVFVVKERSVGPFTDLSLRQDGTHLEN